MEQPSRQPQQKNVGEVVRSAASVHAPEGRKGHERSGKKSGRTWRQTSEVIQKFLWRRLALLETCSMEIKEQLKLRLDELKGYYRNLKAKAISYWTRRDRWSIGHVDRNGEEEEDDAGDVDEMPKETEVCPLWHFGSLRAGMSLGGQGHRRLRQVRGRHRRGGGGSGRGQDPGEAWRQCGPRSCQTGTSEKGRRTRNGHWYQRG